MVRPAKPAGPDRHAAIEMYRRRAGVYDLELALFEPIRRRAIERLVLQRGQTVLDVGCGTGLSLEGLRQAVGPRGRIVGIEQCPAMIEKARERIARHRWRNVTLLCSPVEAAQIPLQAHAALFHFTHDILRRPEALENVFAHLKPGARVVASGLKWAGPFGHPLNLLVWPAAWHSVTSFEGLSRPWSRLAAHGDFAVESAWAGAVYIASGRLTPGAG